MKEVSQKEDVLVGKGCWAQRYSLSSDPFLTHSSSCNVRDKGRAFDRLGRVLWKLLLNTEFIAFTHLTYTSESGQESYRLYN